MPRKIEILVVLVVLVVGCSLVQRREQPPLLDSDGDGDADGDSDSDGDSDTDGDGDADVDGDADGDTDSDTDGDGDCPDNDSDGHTDEACGGDDWDDTNPTVYPDAPELCDDLDNDGDGTVDEGVNDCGGACLITANTPGSPCDGPDTDLCEDDAYECDGLNATVCSDGEENAEICNEEDDNCDGTVDEGCPCSDGDDRPCGKDEGECVAGTQTCDETGSWSGCAGEIGPIDEACNTLDDDCNGEVDEGENACGGVCELADRPDSPCDGSDSDLCADDVYECDGLNETVCSVGDDNAEICNSRDDDCNGEVDEGENACGGVCTLTNTPGNRCDGSDSDLCADDVYECDGANGTTCSIGTDTVEVCNGEVDEDCDGRINEGCTCTNEATLPCGTDVGECVVGTQTCRGGRWSDCEGGTGPADEICDSADNNCDGEVDEGDNACSGACELDNRPGSPCDGVDTDLCLDDEYECDDLNGTVCSTGADNVETCNGLDDDCDPATGCSCSGTAPDVPVAGLYILYFVSDRDREVGGPIPPYMIAPEGGAGLWEEGEGCTFDGCSLLCPLIPVPAGRCVYFNIEVEGRAYPWACGPGGSDTYGRVGVYVDGTYRSNSTSSPAPGGPLGRRGCDFIACPSG